MIYELEENGFQAPLTQPYVWLRHKHALLRKKLDKRMLEIMAGRGG